MRIFWQWGWLSLIFWLWLGTSVTHAAGPPLPLEAYWQKLEAAQAQITRLNNNPAAVDHPAQLAALATRWENITQVALPNGQILPVDHSFLVAQLRATPPNLARLEALLTALLATRNSWPPAHHDGSELDPLKSILARAEFQWVEEQPSPLAVWWRSVLDTLWEWLSFLLPEEIAVTLNGSWFRPVLTGLAALVLVLVLLFMFRELLADLVLDTSLGPTAEDGHEILTADSAFQRAQTLSGAGDYRTAVRYLYLSALLNMDERGLLRYDRAQTNREYLRSVAHLPPLAAILREVIDVFDRVWYGYHPLDETTYAQYAARVTELRHQK